MFRQSPDPYPESSGETAHRSPSLTGLFGKPPASGTDASASWQTSLAALEQRLLSLICELKSKVNDADPHLLAMQQGMLSAVTACEQRCLENGNAALARLRTEVSEQINAYALAEDAAIARTSSEWSQRHAQTVAELGHRIGETERVARDLLREMRETHDALRNQCAVLSHQQAKLQLTAWCALLVGLVALGVGLAVFFGVPALSTVTAP